MTRKWITNADLSEKILSNQYNNFYDRVTGADMEAAIDVVYLEFREVFDTASHDFFIYKQAKEMWFRWV